MRFASSSVAAKIRPALTDCEEIVAAYLFGSVASGCMRPDSDIDIALLLDQEATPFDPKKVHERLTSSLSRVLRGDVHLLILNDASYLARTQVFSKGELLYVRDRGQLARFRMTSFALFAEFAPYLHKTREAFQERTRRYHGG